MNGRTGGPDSACDFRHASSGASYNHALLTDGPANSIEYENFYRRRLGFLSFQRRRDLNIGAM